METPKIDHSAIGSPIKSRQSKLAWLWPVITNEEEARKAARSGGYAAAFIALCTGVFSLVAIVNKQPIAGINGLSLIDAALFTVIAWKIFKFSFLCAVFGLLLECVELFWRWYKNGLNGNIVVPALVILALIAGVRGTAFLHKRDCNRLLATILVIVFSVFFSMYVYRSTHTGLDRNQQKLLDELHDSEQ